VTRHFSTLAKKKAFDYIVIGAGSGGIASARRAALLGQNVLLVEQRVVGGTCVNVGCVPKKVMFNLANYLEDSNHFMKFYGVSQNAELDFPTFKKARNNYVARLNGIYD
jgi:glutathione reductase (NADPH)